MTELNPCPFCKDGGRPERKTTSALFDGEKYVQWSGYVECMECHTQGPIESDQLCERWNTRADRTTGVNGYGNMSGSDMPCNYCNECDGEIPVESNYCPNCGAKVIDESKCWIECGCDPCGKYPCAKVVS